MTSAAFKICPACGARAKADHRYCPSCGSDLSQAQLRDGDPYLGLTVAGKYYLKEFIGEGAMGRVYKAEQLSLRKPFAVKILLPALTHDEASQQRFANEAHNAASLNHPNCVSVVDYGRSPDGAAFIVMEYVEGTTLEDIIIEQFPLPRERIVDLTLQVLAALSEAHGLGILHRDLKPDNILVQTLRTHGELAKVLDFGIAKLMDAAPTASQRPGLTGQGMVCGTPEYMSPEQARGQQLDPRSDLYSVGVVLYEMLTGRPPFESESAIETLAMHLHDEPTPPSQRNETEPEPLEAVCLKALAKDPDERYETANDFRQALIAAASERGREGLRCQSCAGEMRVEDRFCPACGAPAPVRRSTFQRKRHPTRRSGLNVALRRDHERTAEVVVRNFPLPLVGRDDLLGPAHARLSRPKPELFVQALAGPAGVGKTRMADEIASLAEQLGWRVFYVGADPSNARTPLWPIRQMVAQLLDLDLGSLTTQDLGQAANLRGLSFEELPGLAELFQLEGPAHRMEHHVRRRECFASTVQALLHGGHNEPVALLFDDVDNYDAPSREVLRRLARATSSTPLTVVATSTESDLDWLGGQVEHLEPLSENAVRHLCRQVTIGVNPQSSLPSMLTKAAPLTPLRLELQLRVLALGLEAPGDATDSDLLTSRLQHLDEGGRNVLEAGAMLGERFPESDLVDLLAEETDLPSGRELDEILAQLHVDGLLLITERGERAFYHQKLHELVYANIQEARRRTLHRRVATTSRVARSSVNIEARHWLGAGARDAIDVLERAADAAVRSFDDSNAAMQLQAALRMCEGLPENEETLARQARLAGKASEVMRHGEAARTIIEALEGQLKRAHSPRDQGALREALGCQLGRQGRYDDAMSALQKALAPAIAAGDRAAILRIYNELGNVHMRQGNDRRALTELREGLDMCTMGEGARSDVDLDTWRYLLRISDAMRSTGDVAGARAFCEHALYQAERRQDALGRLRCHAQMAFVLRQAQQVTLGEKHLCRALDEARYFGDRLTTAELLLERARARASHGKIDDARRSCKEALRLARTVDWMAGIQHAERALSLFEQERTE